MNEEKTANPLGAATGYPTAWCDACPHLSPTEADQDSQLGRPRLPHRCTKYGFTLKHLGWHPRIPTPPTCGESDTNIAELRAQQNSEPKGK